MTILGGLGAVTSLLQGISAGKEGDKAEKRLDTADARQDALYQSLGEQATGVAGGSASSAFGSANRTGVPGMSGPGAGGIGLQGGKSFSGYKPSRGFTVGV